MNVSGQEVAVGIADPLNMFIIMGVILGVGIIAAIAYSIYTSIK